MESFKDGNLELVIQGCIKKIKKSQEVLYKKFFGYALSVALIYHSRRSDALDIVNDSFLKVFTNIEQYDTTKPFLGWLRKIVINTSIDHLRRNSKNHLLVEIEKQPIQDETPNVISHLTAQDIIKILNQLPHFHRTVFCLYEIEGFSHEEIAEQLSIPTSSSRVYLTRAKKQLRELLPVNFCEDDEK